MSSGQVTSPASATIHRILVVEDDVDTVARMRNDLEECGFEVHTAKDGGQAQASFVMRRPDLVILDLILPGESGFELCERLKQIDDSIPVVIVSAMSLPDSRTLATRVGADGYIVKPWARQQLVQTIDDVARRWLEDRLGHKKIVDRVKFGCQNCGKKFKVSASHRGKSLTCPTCGEPVHVPRHD
jgi:two-component system, OmpR family, response regulator